MRITSFCLVSVLMLSASVGAQPSTRINNVLNLIRNYRKASDTLQHAASDRMLAYCVYREWNAGKPDLKNPKVGWGAVAGARDGIAMVSGKPQLDEISVDAMGNLGRVDIPVTAAIGNFITGEIPLDTDTFRVLRQTIEYDKQNRDKFEDFAGAIEKFSSGALSEGSSPLRKSDRLAGAFGFAGLQQTVGYVARDFKKEFNGKKMLNFGQCAGAAERVLAVERSIQAERDALGAIVKQINLDAADL